MPLSSILVCPTAFKGTFNAREAAEAMADGAASAVAASPREFTILPLPLSDGGNGLLDALHAAGGGKANGVRVQGPLGTSVSARYLVQPERVVVETAEACGLHLVPVPLRDPLETHTRGVGELLLAARAAAPDRPLVVGLGGSATVDAGVGMARALGWEFRDTAGDPVPDGGGALALVATVDPPEQPPVFKGLVVLADVTNPLLGPRGAAPVYGPQKGARPAGVERLESGLRCWADAVGRGTGKEIAALEGGGAAGGLGAAFAALLDAAPRRGAMWVLDAVGFDARLAEAEVVVTGEGAWDEQSSMGKVTGEVVERARRAGVPVVLVAGSVAGDVPDGVVAVGGPGEELDASALAALTREAVAGLLARRRRP